MATGHIEKRGKGKWLLVVDLGTDPGTGKRKRKTRMFKGSEREARKELAKWLAEINEGVYIEPTGMTLEQYLKQWLENRIIEISPHTRRRYKNIVNLRIIPLLGKIRIEEIRPLHLKNFYRKIIEQGRLDGKNGSLSQESLNYHHRVLHKALDDAVKDELIKKNPADIAKPPKIEEQIIDEDEEINEKIQVLNEKQVSIILEKAKNTPYYALLFVAIRTGLRRGELLGLRWKDIDWDKKTISVKQTLGYTKDNGYFFKLPKTKKSRRTIKVDADVLTTLKQHRKKIAENKLFFGQQYKDKGLVFCQVDGKPMHPDTPSKWFPKFLEKINLPRLNFHCLRHTHASLMLKAGADIKQISERLGHSSIQITYDIYSHLYPDKQQEAVDKLQKLLNT